MYSLICTQTRRVRDPANKPEAAPRPSTQSSSAAFNPRALTLFNPRNARHSFNPRPCPVKPCFTGVRDPIVFQKGLKGRNNTAQGIALGTFRKYQSSPVRAK